jgi:hypothetical protein
MSKRLTSIVILCGLLGACSSGTPSVVPLSPECEKYLSLDAAYLDKLEATGRFPPDYIACYRRFGDIQRKQHQNPEAYQMTAEQSLQNCRIGQKIKQRLIQESVNIPNMSQEEFDANWGSQINQRCVF